MSMLPVQKSIKAFFTDLDKAREAARVLINFGFDMPEVGETSTQTDEAVAVYDFNLSDESLAGAYVIGDKRGEAIERAERVLISVDPPMSIGDIYVEEIGGDAPFILTFRAAGNRLNQAVEIIESYGGVVDNQS